MSDDFDFDRAEAEMREARPTDLYDRALAERQMYEEEQATRLLVAANELLDTLLKSSLAEATGFTAKSLNLDGDGEAEFMLDGLRFKVQVWENKEPNLQVKVHGTLRFTVVTSLLELGHMIQEGTVTRVDP